jgi:hypothetical protein
MVQDLHLGARGLILRIPKKILNLSHQSYLPYEKPPQFSCFYPFVPTALRSTANSSSQI